MPMAIHAMRSRLSRRVRAVALRVLGRKPRFMPLDLQRPPILLRKIQKSRWFGRVNIAAGEAPADALKDLETSGNKLSVWLVDENELDVRRVITALAASRDHVTNVDYVVLDYEVFEGMKLKLEIARGNTHDDGANQRWHRDLVELSATQVANFANAVVAKGKKARATERDVISWIQTAVAAGHIDRERLQPNVVAKVFTRT